MFSRATRDDLIIYTQFSPPRFTVMKDVMEVNVMRSDMMSGVLL